MNTKKLKVGIIFGGKSGEHEVSVVSAFSVMKNLDPELYQIMPIGINKQGKWLFGKESRRLLTEEQKKELSSLNKTTKILNKNSKKLIIFESSEKNRGVDVIFPVLHGTYGEDGTMQGLLEIANIPYVGSGVLGSALGMDKVVQKELYAYHNLKQTKFYWFLKKDWIIREKLIIDEIKKTLKYPVFIKPANLGSSVGISKAKNDSDLIKAINKAAEYDNKILIEQGIEDIHEIECSVLGNDDPKASIPGEIISSNEFYDYNAKYVDNKSQAIIPANLPQSILKNIQEMATLIYKILNLSGMSRVDFFVKKNTHDVFINEVNTIPGFTSISMYPKLWEASGLPYPKLLDKLIQLAIEKHQEKKGLKTSFN